MTAILSIPVWVILSAVIFASSSWALEWSDTLSVEINAQGVGIINTLLILSFPHTHVHDVLTDYARWPALFPHKPKMNSIVREPDRTLVDMNIPAFLLPLELHLVTATRKCSPFESRPNW